MNVRLRSTAGSFTVLDLTMSAGSHTPPINTAAS
jgi:hypothetical protein